MTFFTKSYYPYHEKVYIDAKGSSKAFSHLSALGPLLRYSKVEVIFSLKKELKFKRLEM